MLVYLFDLKMQSFLPSNTLQAFPSDFTPEQLHSIRLPLHRELVVQAVRNANSNGEVSIRVPVDKNGSILENELKALGFDVFVQVEKQVRPKGKDQVIEEDVDVVVVSWSPKVSVETPVATTGSELPV